MMPLVLLMIANIVWGIGFSCTKLALQELAAPNFLLLRFSMASAAMLPGLLFFKKHSLRKRDFVDGARLGLAIAALNGLQTLGLQTITASTSAFLSGFSIVFVLLIRCVTRKSWPNSKDLLATLVCVLGLGLITGRQGCYLSVGVAYTLFAAFFSGLHTYAMSKYAMRSNAFLLATAQMWTLTIFSALVALSYKPLTLPAKPITWACIVFCSLPCAAFGYWAQAYFQKRSGALEAAVLMMLEMVFASIFSCVWLGEQLNLSFYLGAAMILAGSTFITLHAKRLSQQSVH